MCVCVCVVNEATVVSVCVVNEATAVNDLLHEPIKLWVITTFMR